MKRQKSKRVLGVGLGIGLAAFGCYHWMPHPAPQPFQTKPNEFQPLSNYHRSSQTDNDQATRLVWFDETGDFEFGQTLIPATDENTATATESGQGRSVNEPNLTTNQPALTSNTGQNLQSGSEWESTASNELPMPSKNSPPLTGSSAAELKPAEKVDVESSSTDSGSLAPPNSVMEDVSSPSLGLQAPANPEDTQAVERLSQMEGSNWKPNPFADGDTVAQDSAGAIAKATESPDVRADEFSPVQAPAKSEKSVVEFERDHSILHQPDQWGNASRQWVAPRTAVDDAIKPRVAEVGGPSGYSASASQRHHGRSESVPNRVVSMLASGDPSVSNPALQTRTQSVQLPLSESVAQKAVHHIEYGKSLARRGSSHVARQEFYSALTILAQANDAGSGTNEHTMALRNGILALKDSEDFVVHDTESQIGLNVKNVTETHRLNLLTESEKQTITPIEAMQRYFGYAEQHLELAGGRNVVAAEALYCLGKLHSVIARHEPGQGRLDMAKAIVFHRASLNSDANNYRSANELGVLMARSGQMEEAKDLFKTSILIQPTPQTWNNLAKVHERLGESRLAQLAQTEFQRTVMAESSGGQTIQWMAANEFNANAPSEVHESDTRKPLPTRVAQPAAKEAKSSPSLAERIKRIF